MRSRHKHDICVSIVCLCIHVRSFVLMRVLTVMRIVFMFCGLRFACRFRCAFGFVCALPCVYRLVFACVPSRLHLLSYILMRIVTLTPVQIVAPILELELIFKILLTLARILLLTLNRTIVFMFMSTFMTYLLFSFWAHSMNVQALSL